MTKPWEEDNCESLRTHYQVFSVPEAAARWCGVPESELKQVVEEVKPLSHSGFGRGVWAHPTVPCIEPRSRAIAEAIESGELPHGREDGQTLQDGDSAAAERRAVLGKDLKAWMEKAFPNQKPAFLFDDIEQASHSSITVDSYRVLKAENDAIKLRLKNAEIEYKKLREKSKALKAQLQKQQAETASREAASPRSEASYQRIIAALLSVIEGDLPDVDKHPSIKNVSQLVNLLEEHYQGYEGLSKRNLAEKFPASKRRLEE